MPDTKNKILNGCRGSLNLDNREFVEVHEIPLPAGLGADGRLKYAVESTNFAPGNPYVISDEGGQKTVDADWTVKNADISFVDPAVARVSVRYTDEPVTKIRLINATIQERRQIDDQGNPLYVYWLPDGIQAENLDDELKQRYVRIHTSVVQYPAPAIEVSGYSNLFNDQNGGLSRPVDYMVGNGRFESVRCPAVSSGLMFGHPARTWMLARFECEWLGKNRWATRATLQFRAQGWDPVIFYQGREGEIASIDQDWLAAFKAAPANTFTPSLATPAMAVSNGKRGVCRRPLYPAVDIKTVLRWAGIPDATMQKLGAY